MDRVVVALAEAIWPSLPADVTEEHQARTFLDLSGADCPGIANDVDKVITKQLYGSNKTKLLLLLRLMAHRLPMLLLAGKYCVSSNWPFVLSVSEMTVDKRQAMLTAWARSPLPIFRQAYKGIKSLIAAVLLTHIDARTHSNLFFKGMGYTPGASPVSAGPPPATAAEYEELLASATLHLPEVVAVAGPGGAQAHLTKRGFRTSPPDQHAHSTVNGSRGDSSRQPHTSQHSSESPACQPGTLDLYYDAVVVGSGAGGGVTAAVLAAAGLKVLVVEKASWVRSKDMTWLEGDAFEQMYERGGFLLTQDGGLTILAGSTLGGGTKINWTASIQPPRQVRSEWASSPHGLTDFGPDSHTFDASLEAVCRRLGVRTGTAMSGPNAKLMQGMQNLGVDVEEYPRNCLSKTCTAYCNMGCRSGHKQTSEVWLVEAVRAGAQVLTGVEVQRVVTVRQKAAPGSTRDSKVTGVLARCSSSSSASSANASSALTLMVHAPLVISSCGAINTPALLLRSGITVGGNVGANLRLHPATGIVAFFKQTQQQADAGRGAVEMFEGVSMAALSRAAGHWDKGGYGALVSVPACHPGLLAAITPDTQPGGLKRLMMMLKNASPMVVFTRDSSSGRVTIDNKGRPVVSYWPCSTTRQHLLEGISLGLRAAVAAGAVHLVVPNAAEPWELALKPDQPMEVTQQQLEALVARMQAVGIRKFDVPLFSAHQMGSCCMGSSRRSSVCDRHGEVWDVSGLYVADGSVFPTPTGVNPMITIYAIAHLTAQGIANRWKQQAAAAGQHSS